MPTIARQDATLYYETHGSGHPLVFIHGGGGNTLAFYQQVMHFRDRYRVITMDLRGFHRSVLAPGVVSHPADFPTTCWPCWMPRASLPRRWCASRWAPGQACRWPCATRNA